MKQIIARFLSHCAVVRFAIYNLQQSTIDIHYAYITLFLANKTNNYIQAKLILCCLIEPLIVLIKNYIHIVQFLIKMISCRWDFKKVMIQWYEIQGLEQDIKVHSRLVLYHLDYKRVVRKILKENPLLDVKHGILGFSSHD